MRTILVPLDGSQAAEAALPLASRLAGSSGARLVLVTVYEPPLPVRGGQGALVFDQRFDAENRAALRSYLDQVTGRVRQGGEPGLEVDGRLLDGSAAATIAEFAEHEGADLVVLTSHGHGGPSHLWMGGVTDALVRQLRVPILVVRADAASPAASRAGTAGAAFRRVLVPLDGTPESEQALEAADAVAGRDGVLYTLLRVVTPRHPLLRGIGGRDDELVTAERRADAERRLALVEERLRQRGFEVRSEVRVEAQVAPAILELAGRMEADLIAVTSHGRGRMGRLLLGSVADKVLRGAPMPVLVRHVVERAAGGGVAAGDDAAGVDATPDPPAAAPSGSPQRGRSLP